MAASVARARSHADRWLLLLIFLLAVGVRTAAASQLAAPAGFDAQYYFMVARNLAAGRGLVVDAIWQFLDQPRGLPHPAGGIWLPLTSLVQAVFLLLSSTYRAAQIPQVLSSSVLVVLACLYARQLTGRLLDGLVAAGLVLFGGGAVMATHVDVDCYATFALTAGLALYAMSLGWSNSRWLMASGLFIGLAALTRNDGLLLLLVFGLYALWMYRCGRSVSRQELVGAISAFVVVCAPWWVRNWLTFGRISPVPPLYPALLREYAEFFTLEPHFTWQHLLSAGWHPLAASRLRALVMNAVRLAWTFQLWQVPFIALGVLAAARAPARGNREQAVRDRRRSASLFPVLLYPVLLYLSMSLIYTFPGLQGGFSHSVSAWVPFGAALAAVGLGFGWQIVARFAKLERWQRSLRVFQVGAVFIASLVGVTIARAEINNNRRLARSNELIAAWVRSNTDPDTVIITNNSMGISLFADRSTVAIPFEGLSSARQAAQRFGAELLIVWQERPQGLSREFVTELVLTPLPMLASWTDCQVYLFEGN